MRELSCETVVAFKGATGSKPPRWGGRQLNGIPPIIKSWGLMTKINLGWAGRSPYGISPLQTPGTVDNRRVQCSVVSPKEDTDDGLSLKVRLLSVPQFRL